MSLEQNDLNTFKFSNVQHTQHCLYYTFWRASGPPKQLFLKHQWNLF